MDDYIASTAVAGALALGERDGLVVVESARVLDSDSPTMEAWHTLQLKREALTEYLRPDSGTAPAARRAADGKALVDVCDTAMTLITKIADGGKSLLQDSALADDLHLDRFGGVLVIRGAGASSSQLLDDRPLMFQDAFSVVGTASIAFFLVNARAGSKVLTGGLAVGTTAAHGKIGSKIELSSDL